MKKIFSILLITIILIGAIALTSCVDQPEEPDVPAAHVHSFVETVVAPTCSAHGYTLKQCQGCEYVMYDGFVDPDGVTHSFEEVSITEPTCKNYGYVTNKCVWCALETYDIINPRHTFGDWFVSVDPACESEGVERRECIACDDDSIFEERAIPATGHTHEGTVTPPSCLEDGYTTYVCHCGDTYVADATDATGHSFGDWATTSEPTCDVDGVEERVCSSCGASETNPIPAGHLVGEEYEKEVVPPTCTTLGYTVIACHGCDYTRNDNPVAMTDHTYGEWHVDVAPTCTMDGFQSRTCTGCGKVDTAYIDMIPHTYGEWINTTPATCTAKGEDTRTCSCGDYETREVAILPHTYSDWVNTTPATCTTKGEDRKTCSCGAYESREVAMLPHTYGDWVNTTPATCTAKGEDRKTCSCGAYESREVAMLPHTYSDWVNITPATCTAKGEDRKTCSCGAYESREVAMLPHVYVETVVAPTETNTGYTIHTCACGDEYIDSYVSAAGSAGIVIENGIVTSKGTFAGDVLVIPYSYGEDKVTKLGAQVFINCDNITTVYLTANITSIDTAAFAYSDNITTIYFEGTVAQWKAIVKGANWNAGLPSYTVICSDGTTK